MYINKKLYAALLIGGVLLATSCVDDKYDLSDIDTTTAIKLDGLTVPVNLSEITLDQVLKVDEDDPDNPVQIIDGYYVIQKGGSFMADPVTVDMLEATDNTYVPTLDLTANGTQVTPLPSTTTFSYKVKNVDEALKSLTYLNLQQRVMQVDLNMTPANLNYTNVELQIPEGYVATYKGQNYFKGNIPVTIENGSLDEPFYITEMEFMQPLFPEMIDGVNTLDITGPIGFNSLTLGSSYSGTISADFIMYPFTANIASGNIFYEIDDPQIDPVNLDDLPDFLKEGETKLILTNPQLYLNFPPMYGADYTGMLTITPNGPGTIQFNPFQLKDFPTNLVVAVDPDNLSIEDQYPNAVKQPNPQLSYLVYGDGLPDNIHFELSGTNLNGDITNFELGQEITVEGKYTFVAPLSMEAGSEIIYQKKETDFFGDDMEDVNVQDLQITSTVTTDLPFAVNITVYPLDKYGNRIKNGAVYATSGVPAYANKTPLDLHLKDFQGLDGVEYIVTADDMDGTQLTPENTILLQNIRATVTGEYVTKL